MDEQNGTDSRDRHGNKNAFYGMEPGANPMTTDQSTREASVWTLTEGKEEVSCVYVEPDEFRTLAISSRKLTRADSTDEGICGLFDVETGERFIVRRAKLFRRSGAARPK